MFRVYGNAIYARTSCQCRRYTGSRATRAATREYRDYRMNDKVTRRSGGPADRADQASIPTPPSSSRNAAIARYSRVRKRVLVNDGDGRARGRAAGRADERGEGEREDRRNSAQSPADYST